jgi:hypothetical protein
VGDVHDLLTGPCNQMADLPTEAAGNEDLKNKLGEFGDSWDYGIGKLADVGGACVDALKSIDDTFTGLDEELEKVLTEGEKK